MTRTIPTTELPELAFAKEIRARIEQDIQARIKRARAPMPDICDRTIVALADRLAVRDRQIAELLDLLAKPCTPRLWCPSAFSMQMDECDDRAGLCWEHQRRALVAKLRGTP